MANSAEFRHENSQSTAGMIQNVTGHGSSRPIIPSQSIGHCFMLFGFLYYGFENL
jgi:RNA polymerase II C-terminal domain phosphatase-like 1/2